MQLGSGFLGIEFVGILFLVEKGDVDQMVDMARALLEKIPIVEVVYLQVIESKVLVVYCETVD